MPRPRRIRRIEIEPEISFYTPKGVKNAEELILSFDEHEALRLVDREELNQAEAAKKMDVSQPTLNRLLKIARKKVALAITSGRAIRIEGGNYMLTKPEGRGRQNGLALGPGAHCVCPECAEKVAHTRGVPCYTIKCPKCGAKMGR